MLTQQSGDGVHVVLTAVDAPSTDALRDRHLFLTKDNPTISIGRTSKRNANFEPASNNAWIDSAVMSRDHARLNLDVEAQKVFIRDIGSLHGTFRNGVRLARNQPQALKQGDLLKFGITVERSTQTFPPCVLRVTLDDDAETRPIGKPVVFRVPDDSDIEDGASDEDSDLSIRNSSQILRENGIRPAQPVGSKANAAIDLTLDLTLDDENAIGVAAKTQRETFFPPALSPRAKTSQARLQTPRIQGPRLNGPQLELVTQHLSAVVESRDDGNSPDADLTSPQTDKQADGQIQLSDANEWDDYDSSSVASPPTSSLEPPSDSLSAFELNGKLGFDGVPKVPSSSTGSLPQCPCDCDGDDTAPEQHVIGSVGQVPASKLDSGAKTAPEVESPTAQDTEQPTGDCCNPANTIISGAEADQHAALGPLVKPPSRDSSQSVESGRHQPTTNGDQAVLAAPLLYLQSSPQTTAEVLGARTGKFEYFYARSHNRLMAATSFRDSATQPSPPMASQTLPSSPGPVCDDNPPLKDANKDDEGQQGVQEHDGSLLGPIDKVDSFVDTQTSALLAAGEKFLSSPLQELEARPAAPLPLELDETSAYQFGMSKKATGTSNGLACRRTKVVMHGYADACPGNSSDERRPCRKRKAESMSGLVAEEQDCDAEATEGPSRKASHTVPFTVDCSRAVKVAEAPVTRPAKRFRRAAEVFGYAALGGVAVMSALIATAPTL